jgi:muramoyltetrapeptide carboxypeptidase
MADRKLSKLPRLTGCLEAYGVSYQDAIDEFLVPLGKLLLTNLTTAHGLYRAEIPIGAAVNLNTANNTLTVLEQWSNLLNKWLC